MRILLLIVVPVALPFLGWKLWKMFGPPARVERIEGPSGKPLGGDIPLIELMIAGVVLAALTLGANILLSEKGKSTYTPLGTSMESGNGGG